MTVRKISPKQQNRAKQGKTGGSGPDLSLLRLSRQYRFIDRVMMTSSAASACPKSLAKHGITIQSRVTFMIHIHIRNGGIIAKLSEIPCNQFKGCVANDPG